MAKEKRKSEHYVNNKEFSAAVLEYTITVQAAKKVEATIPIVPNYIAECFLKISEGLSHRSNFVRYTYREEMVMDGVENCLRAVNNYDPEAATRSGNPNAFSYFTQIIWYAFLRRIAKEKKHQDIKIKFIAQSGFEAFITQSEGGEGDQNVKMLVDVLYGRIDHIRRIDTQIKDFAVIERKKKIKPRTDSDVTDFIVEDNS